MKKLISIFGLLVFCVANLFASDTQSFVIQGANYMPTDVGAKYIYSKKMVSVGDNPVYKKIWLTNNYS